MIEKNWKNDGRESERGRRKIEKSKKRGRRKIEKSEKDSPMAIGVE